MLDTVVTPRTELRAAIGRRDAALEAEANAARAVVRAKSLLDDAEQTYSILAGVDDEIAKHRADEITAWATNRGDKPTGDLPWHMESRKGFKTDAETNVAAVRSAYDVLVKQQVESASRAAGAEAAVRRAAGAVLTDEAGPLIGQLIVARRTLWALEDKLKALSAVRYSEADGTSVLIKMPPETFAALHETAPPMIAGSVPKPFAIALDRWNAYLRALTADAGFEFDALT